MDLEYKLKKYENGLLVLYVPMPKSYIIYYEAQILAGRYYEEPSEIESAHFLEHLNGQFTSKKYPHAQEMAKLLEQLGVQNNAYVSDYLTGYYLYGQQKHATKLFEILSESLTNFFIDKKILKQERNSILEELEENINDHWYQIEQKAQEILFPGHPGNRSIQTSIDNVKHLTLNDLLNYRKRLYQPDRMLITIVGDLSFTAMSEMVKKSGLTRLPANPKANAIEPPTFNWPTNDPTWPVFVRNTQMNGKDATQIIMLWRVPITDQSPDIYPLSGLCHVLSNGMGSHLMLRLRTELGLIYSIRCHLQLDPQNPQLSYLAIVTNTQGRHLKTIVKNVVAEIERMRNSPLTPKEFMAVSNQIQMEFLDKQFELDPISFAEQYSHGVLWGHPIKTFKKDYKKYEAVTHQDIQRVAKEYLDPEKLITIYSAKYPIKQEFGETHRITDKPEIRKKYRRPDHRD